MAQTVAPSQMLDVSSMTIDNAVHTLISQAAELGASDLFILSHESFVGVSIRHLGIVRPLSTVGADQGRKFIQHIKAQAGMDVGEHRRPLDGRWIYESDDGSIVDLRISSVPTLHGEDFTIRLLDHERAYKQLGELGLSDNQLRQFKTMLASPGGLILCTGPTGSGKTTSLYASLNALSDGTRKINTIEDPIEYELHGLRQSQINPILGLGFSDLLRSVLRQSPDVIMIGEIRDQETAQTVVRAANSGHLVFSTLHAPVAAAAIQSMKSLDVHPHFLATSLRCVITQRLLRTLCTNCRIEFDLSHAPEVFAEIKPLLGPAQGPVFCAPKGCERCGMSGYDGRTGVFEVMDITRDLRNLIAAEAPTAEIRTKAAEGGMIEFRKMALLKVARGETSIEEVFRVIPTEYLVLDD